MYDNNMNETQNTDSQNIEEVSGNGGAGETSQTTEEAGRMEGQTEDTATVTDASETDTVTADAGATADSNAADTQENHEYRYGRSYYQNQQDSVYRTTENAYQSQSTQNTQSVYGNTNSYGAGHGSYQTYTTGTHTAYTQTAESPSGNNNKKKTARGTGRKILKVVAGFVLVAAVGSGSAFATVKLLENGSDSVKQVAVTTTGTKDKGTDYKVSTVSSTTAVVTDVSDVVKNTMPSVVKITNIGTTTYEGFFGQSQTYESESNGSGIIIGQTDTELLVATNQHVVSGADELKVIFIDEEECVAHVKGTDAEKDLAVIAVPLEEIKEETLEQIKVATLGDSDALNVGEPAIAIGNALGYGQSVTLGVISAKEREVTTENGTNTLIQTDAAINPGNSGGALLNMAGEVIGINSVKYSSTEVEGMGYAIPISDATPIINELMNKETKTKVDKDEQAYMGITGLDITSDVAQTYNMPQGVYITQVVKNGPAEEAGLKKGDIITKIAGVSVTSFDELKAELEYHAAGTKVEVEILTPADGSYGYKNKTVEVTLAKKKD